MTRDNAFHKIITGEIWGNIMRKIGEVITELENWSKTVFVHHKSRTIFLLREYSWEKVFPNFRVY
jgi:hypothetical protein